MFNAPVVRPLKRVLRRIAPGLAGALAGWVDATAVRRAQVEKAQHSSDLDEVQRRFDAAYPVDKAMLQQVAQESTVIIIGIAPYPNVSMLIDELAKERIVIGELVIVDATPETPQGVAIRDHVAAWRFRLPLTRLTVTPYNRLELRYADAIRQGVAAASRSHIWIAGRDYVPLSRGFEYLLKAFIAEGQRAVVVTHTVSPGGVLQHIDVPSVALSSAVRDMLLVTDEFTLLDLHTKSPAEKLSLQPLLGECESFWRGIFGGSRQVLLGSDPERWLDDLFVTEIAVADLALRLKETNVKLVHTGASAVTSMRERLTDASASWEAIHDWRWLIDKRQCATAVDTERIELVCPFHRGDVVLAIHVAACAREAGKQVRLHVAEQLVSWVRDIDPDIAVEPIPVRIAKAEETYALVLASYKYVAQRADASPRLARCHPSRSLSDTGGNLVAYMLEEVGLPRNAALPNRKPITTVAQRDIARQLTQPYGNAVVFLHPLGGWGLKSIPTQVIRELGEAVHKAGFSLVQIGGATDAQIEDCDGAILENFLPSQWCEILKLGRALIGVDSWSAHFASALDIPQVTLYGSTHPCHVNTKAWFAEQKSPSLTMGPIVNCSPCNSLNCLTFPERTYCTGYCVDHHQLERFLTSL